MRTLRQFLVFVILGMLFLGLAADYAIISDDKVYSSLAKILVVLSIAGGLITALLGMNSKILVPVSYMGGSLVGNLTVLSLYLWVINILEPTSILTKIIFLMTFVIVEAILLIKRIVLKDKAYIVAIQKGKQGSYVQRDILFTSAIAVILIGSGKLLDIDAMYVPMHSFEELTTFSIGLLFTMIGIVICVTGYAHYLYGTQK